MSEPNKAAEVLAPLGVNYIPRGLGTYVLYNRSTRELHQEQQLTAREVLDFNQELQREGSNCRWIPDYEDGDDC